MADKSDEQGLPEPLVPAHIDLRGYEFMPFYGDRCFSSESWLQASAEARLAMLRVWWHAFSKEVPGASLPDVDKLLCEYAGFGANPQKWRKLRGEIMNGFIKCRDGRLYHKFISPLAIDAWEFRESQRNRTKAAREARLLRNQLQRTSQPLSQNDTGPPNSSVTESTGQDRTETDNPLPPADAGGAPDGAHAPPMPDCPHERIIALYHELMPLNPQVLEWTETRRGHLRARWREKALPNGRTQGYATVDAGLAFWRRFFGYCAESKFLTGRAEAKPGKPPFCPGLDWLLKPENFAKVLEGRYHE